MLLSCHFSKMGVYFQKHGVEKDDFMIKLSLVVSSCLLAVLLLSEHAGPRWRHRRAPGALGTPRSWGTRSSSGGQRPRASNGAAWGQGEPSISGSGAMGNAGRLIAGAETSGRGRALPSLSGVERLSPACQ
jgi:hypothetical protein